MKAALALVAAMLATGLHGATGEAVGTLLASSNVPVAAGNSIASAPAPVLVAARAASERANVAAPAEPAYESTFTPLTALPAQVKAPSVKQTSAFVALNALLSAQTRFSEDVIGMSVSLQRAQAADAAGAQLWYLRQTNASAEYAGFAADVVSGFPALQTTMAQAFVADKMSLTLTPAQVAAAKAKLRQGPPAAFMQVLQVAAAPYQHSGAPEAAAIRAAILGATPTLQAELADLPATALVLPAVLASSSITTAEVRLASALRSYSHSILLPVREASPAAATERPELGAGPSSMMKRRDKRARPLRTWRMVSTAFRHWPSNLAARRARGRRRRRSNPWVKLSATPSLPRSSSRPVLLLMRAPPPMGAGTVAIRALVPAPTATPTR